MNNRYSFNIEWSEEDREFMATCPAFPGLSAFGETEEEALREAKFAVVGFIETFKANNFALPEPASKGLLSGKFQLRLPKSLHSLVARLAENEGVSLNTYIMDAVRARASGEQIGSRILNELRIVVASAMTVRPQETHYTTTTKDIVELGTYRERRKSN